MKVERHSKILQLINQYDIETQEELVSKLQQAGFDVTQATISRDIRELRLSKATNEKGKQKYVVMFETNECLNDKYIRVLRDGFLNMDYGGNIIVIKTVSGMAMAVAAALDKIQIKGIIGSIAGDDTIFCAVREKEETIKIIQQINVIIHNPN